MQVFFSKNLIFFAKQCVSWKIVGEGGLSEGRGEPLPVKGRGKDAGNRRPKARFAGRTPRPPKLPLSFLGTPPNSKYFSVVFEHSALFDKPRRYYGPHRTQRDRFVPPFVDSEFEKLF